MKRVISAAVLGAMMVTAPPAESGVWFDGARQGLLFDLGLGVGAVRNDLAVGTESSFAVRWGGGIGFGLHDQFALRLAFSGYSYRDKKDSVIQAWGVTYWLAERAPSTFLKAAVGPYTISDPGAGEIMGEGLGVTVGVGREFARNWTVEVDLTWGRPDSDSRAVYGPNCYGIGVRLAHIFY